MKATTWAVYCALISAAVKDLNNGSKLTKWEQRHNKRKFWVKLIDDEEVLKLEYGCGELTYGYALLKRE
jgi:hypothetical protein